MTGNEAIEMLNNIQVDTRDLKHALKCSDLIETAVNALEEVQEYQKIGTVEELKTAQKYIDLARKHETIGKVIEACAEYESIGTVEECMEAVEKQKPEKPIKSKDGNLCCSCGLVLQIKGVRKALYYCTNCGNKIDWSEEEKGK